MHTVSKRSNALNGSAQAPGDKSVSHRALIISGMRVGTTTIKNLLEGEDVLNTLKAVARLGAVITNDSGLSKECIYSVNGVGIGGYMEPDGVLDFGNSGTGCRLVMGVLATHDFNSFFTGDASLSSRPMQRVITPLKLMGAEFTSRSKGRLPMALTGAKNPIPVRYELPVPSAQVKSAILLAALNTPGNTVVVEREPTRDHTENMLKFLGASLEVSDSSGIREISIQGQQELVGGDVEITVPGDPSSAAFLIVAAIITPDSRVEVKNVCINPLRVGLFDTLREMGADITFHNQREQCGELVADIIARSSRLKGVTVPAHRAPSMIDEYPILGVAAAFADGTTEMLGLAELKVKESNRLRAIAESLEACGVRIEEGGDSLKIYGNGQPPAGGALIKARMDHRIIMSFLVMGLASREPVSIDDTSLISTSFPVFIELINRLGGRVEIVDADSSPQKSDDEEISITPCDFTLPVRKKPFVIAIDGPAASGKGTLGRKLAAALNLDYLDTGSLYRAVALRLVYANASPNDAAAAQNAARSITIQDLVNPVLRQERVGNMASIVAAMPQVRQELLNFQRQFAQQRRGAVLDGRDIGTVVCPDADVKLFVTGSINARAKRRHRELQGQGIEVIFNSVVKDLEERDERDAKRDAAPMQPANGAVIMDTTNLSARDVFEKALELVKQTVKI